MLAALEAHSRSLLGLPSTSAEASGSGSGSSSDDDGDEEGDNNEEDYDDEFDDGWGADDAFVTDSEDEFAAPAKKAKKSKSTATTAASTSAEPAAPKVVEVVFAPTTGGRTEISRADKKAFLKGNSAKIMGGIATAAPPGKRTKDEEEDASNQRLDQELHSMLLQNLLPSAAEMNRPVDKRNAISGRLRELADDSAAGEGAADLKATSRLKSHPAKVRTGLMHAAQRRAEAARAESEAAGSWVKGKGGLGDLGRKGAGKRPNMQVTEERTFGDTKKKRGMAGTGGKKVRAKGLGMGVGRFEGGALKISEREIERVNGLNKRKRAKGPGKMKGW